MLHVIRHLFHEFLFLYLLFTPNTDVIMTLLQYFTLPIPFSYEDKLLASIEQCTVDASIDQWHSRVKTCICAEGRRF